MAEFFQADCKSLLLQFTHQEKQLNLKRRWLAGLPMSKEQVKDYKAIASQNKSTIPESLLREDDVYYETLKAFVENRLGQRDIFSREKLVKPQHFSSSDEKKDILYLLDDMTSIALCNLAEMLTGGSMKFKKTRRKMKKVIKELLPKILDNKNMNYDVTIQRQISQFLQDPQNFRRMLNSSESDHSYLGAIWKILDRLEEFPTAALSAMHRRLKGTKGSVPQLGASRRGLRKDVLLPKVRELCTTMLAELDGNDNELLPEPLAEAMAVGSSTLKLILGCKFAPEFKFTQGSPDVEFFQNEVARAVHSLNQKGKFKDIKKLQALLDPNAKLSNPKLVLAVKRVLTEYLFECDDLQKMPRWLLETLAIVNKSSQSNGRVEEMKETGSISNDVEDEVESILSISALTKQVAWDLLPDSLLDFDFFDAYMEDLEETDDEAECTKNDGGFCDEQTESIGEVSNSPRTEKEFCSPFSESNGRSKVKLESMDDAEMDAVDSYYSSSSCVDSKDDIGSYTANLSVHGKLKKNYATTPEHSVISKNESHDSVTGDTLSGEKNDTQDEQHANKNKYLAIQEASDETSMVAYRLIGRLLNTFAQRDGIHLKKDAVSYLGDTSGIARSSKENDSESLILQAVEELIPSFPESGREKLKHLLDLNPNFAS